MTHPPHNFATLFKNQINTIEQHIDTIRQLVIEAERIESNKQGVNIPSSIFNYTSSEFTYSPVITVIGNRGSGKTSLLHEAVRSLANSSDIVLPVIYPEQFVARDHFLHVIMIIVKRCVDVLTKEKEASRICTETMTSSSPTLEDQFRRLYKQVMLYILNEQDNIIGLMGRTGDFDLDVENFIMDGQEIFASGYQIHEQFQEFFQKLTNQYNKYHLRSESEDTPLLIIPIDDVDTYAKHFSNIVDFITSCANIPYRMVFILTADPKTLSMVTRENLIKKYAVLSDPATFQTRLSEMKGVSGHIDQEVSSYLLKFFPQSYRVTLQEFSFEERLDFTPVSPNGSDNNYNMLELLDRIHCDDAGKLSDLFCLHLNGTIVPTPYLDILTGNPRTLETIFSYLNGTAQKTIPSLFAIFKGLWDITAKKYISPELPLDEIVRWDNEKESLLFNRNHIKIYAEPAADLATILGPWKVPFYYFYSTIYATYKDNEIHQEASAWLLFLMECSQLKIKSNVFPGVSISVAFTDFIPFFQPAEMYPLPIFLSPKEPIISSIYIDKLWPTIARELQKNNYYISGAVYQINNTEDQQKFIIKSLAFHIALFYGLILESPFSDIENISQVIWEENSSKQKLNELSKDLGEKIYTNFAQENNDTIPLSTKSIINDWRIRLRAYFLKEQIQKVLNQQLLEKLLKGNTYKISRAAWGLIENALKIR